MTELSPIDWAKRPLQKYADFTGRAPRAEYWWFVLFVGVVSLVLTIIENLVGLDRTVLGLYGPITAIFYLAILIPYLAVAVRRLHDTNRTGWWLLPAFGTYIVAMVLGRDAMTSGDPSAMTGSVGILMLVAFVLLVVLVIFYCLRGTPGDNKYGPDPYAGHG